MTNLSVSAFTLSVEIYVLLYIFIYINIFSQLCLNIVGSGALSGINYYL